MSLKDLKPCPFCTNTNVWCESSDVDDERQESTEHHIFCYICKATGPSAADHDRAAAHWNLRPDFSQQQYFATKRVHKP